MAKSIHPQNLSKPFELTADDMGTIGRYTVAANPKCNGSVFLKPKELLINHGFSAFVESIEACERMVSGESSK